MTLADPRLLDWSVAPLSARDHSDIADFVATTDGLAGRKFAADSRDIAEQLGSAFTDAAIVLRDENRRVRGYTALHRPHGNEPELLADFVLDPAAPPDIVDELVAATVTRFHREAATTPGAYLRAIVGDDQQVAIDALARRGARKEADFARTRKPLHDEDVEVLAKAAVPGISILRWPEVTVRGIGEQVRQLQYATFLEHFGNMSKSPEDWQHHIESRSFAPDFSLVAIDEDDVVIGYVLGSVYTAGAAAAQEHSAHTDYIGVRADQRRRGIAELLLRNVWLAALRRGVPVASLGTDVNNRSRAHVLYRRLGYVTVERSSAYRIDGDHPEQ